MTRTVLILSLIANALFLYAHVTLLDEHDRLVTWACAAGNGGHECGEVPYGPHR